MYCGGEPRPVDNSAPLTCPGCGERMQVLEKRGLAIDVCPGCSGTWYDRGELETHLETEQGPVPAPTRERSEGGVGFRVELGGDDVVYRRCPRCQSPMMRRNHLGSSGIIVDECGTHGMYLDAGELDHIRWFLANGGPEHVAKLEAEEERSRQFRKRMEKLQPQNRQTMPTRRGLGYGFDAGDAVELGVDLAVDFFFDL